MTSIIDSVIEAICESEDALEDMAQAAATVLGIDYKDGDEAWLSSDSDDAYDMVSYRRGSTVVCFSASELAPENMRAAEAYTLLVFDNPEDVLESIEDPHECFGFDDQASLHSAVVKTLSDLH